MREAWQSVVAQVHVSGRRLGLAITGGGTSAIAELLRLPGGSRTLVEAVVPYDLRALSGFLGYEPSHACSGETAIAMARRARDRAGKLTGFGVSCVGVGATASLVSDRQKRGEHRCHIAAATGAGVNHISILLEKGRRDRVQEEELVGTAILHCIAMACNVESPGVAALMGANDQITFQSVESLDTVSHLFRGEVDRITVLPDGHVVANAAIPRCVLAGSFDPLHKGHVGLSRAAADILGLPVSFEISVLNVDKAPLDADTLRRRAEQFSWWANVEITRAPTFLEKSQLFPGATFVIGADTVQRIVAPKYYSESQSSMLAALEQIASRGCAFQVAARADATGQLRSLAEIAIPPSFKGLFRQIPESRFRLDLSSSNIRAQTQSGP
jgi:nicotinamide mononucleotide (NMN) deamidase PncC